MTPHSPPGGSTPRGLRILNITTSYPLTAQDFSGVFIHWANKELARRGLTVQVLAPGAPGAPARETLDGVDVRRFSYFAPRGLQRVAYGDGMPTNLRRSRLARAQLPLFAASLLLHAALLARRSDVIHCHWAHSALLALPLKRLLGKPLVLTVWGSDIRTMRRGLLRFIARNCNRIVSPALDTHANLERAGVERFEYIPALIDPERFHPGVDASGMRDRLRLGDQPLVLFLGRLYPEKDPVTFVRSIPHVLAEKGDVRFVVAGGGVLLPELERLRAELGLERNLDLVGPTHEGNQYLKLASCFVACSTITNVWSSTIAEAMAMRVPVVVTKSTPVDEAFFSDGADCIFARPADPADLARQVLAVLGDPGLAERLRRGGQELLRREGRTPEQITDRLLALYRELQ